MNTKATHELLLRALYCVEELDIDTNHNSDKQERLKSIIEYLLHDGKPHLDARDIKPGMEIRYTAVGGGDWCREKANKYLELGKVYTVSHKDMGGSYTDVTLVECPAQQFNSCLFSPYLPELDGLVANCSK
jgi:hypothetical protein